MKHIQKYYQYIIIITTFLVMKITVIEFDYSFSEDNVNKKCSNEWTKRGELNVRMFNYCKRKQKESYTELLHLISEINNDEVFSKFFNDKFKLIWNYWTKQGITDYSMVKYTLYKEYDAYKDFLYEVKLPNIDSDKLYNCINSVRDPVYFWQLVMSCYKQ